MIRKSFIDLTDQERDQLANAFNQLWDQGLIETNAALHDDNFLSGIHWGPAFLPWHRDFLRNLEEALQDHAPGLMLPFWDWSQAHSQDLELASWKEMFGGRSNEGGQFDHWSYERNSGPGDWELPPLSMVVSELEAANFLRYRSMETGSHVPGHTWTGGTMATGRSPLDPLFYLHHCNLDRLWSVWQINNEGLEQYEHEGRLPSDSVPQARVPLNEPMIGGATPASMLDHTALGYGYARDEALEQAWFDKHGTDLTTGTVPRPAPAIV